MDYKKLAADLLSGCEENCADCEYAGENEFECTIAQLAATAITDMLARAETAEARCKRLEEARENANEAAAKWEGMYHMALERAEKVEYIASDLCDDFTDFVTGGVPNAAPYCANCRPECVDGRGWCNGDNRVCKGFLPKAAGVKEE